MVNDGLTQRRENHPIPHSAFKNFTEPRKKHSLLNKGTKIWFEKIDSSAISKFKCHCMPFPLCDETTNPSFLCQSSIGEGKWLRLMCRQTGALMHRNNSPKFSPPQMSMAVSYFPKWLNQDLSITKSPPAMMGVLRVERVKKEWTLSLDTKHFNPGDCLKYCCHSG